jgi:hypothetical protein
MHIIAGVARHGAPSPLDRMLVLPMAAARAHVPPSVILDLSYQVTNLHRF